MTAIIDGYFYRPTSHPLAWWPELSAFMFNIPQGKAAEWGVMPWYQYLADLPRLLMASLPLLAVHPILFWNKAGLSQMSLLGLPCAAALAALSCIGHKVSLSKRAMKLKTHGRNGVLWSMSFRYSISLPLSQLPNCAFILFRRTKLIIRWNLSSQHWNALIRLVLIGMVCLNIAVTVLLSVISGQNYPGGRIGPLLENITQGQAGKLSKQHDCFQLTLAKIWVPAAALHSGATIYTLPPTSLIHPEIGSNITIVRPESSYEASHSPSGNSPAELWEEKYDYVVTDDLELFAGSDVEKGKSGWELAADQHGYKGVGVMKSWPFIDIKMGRRLSVVRRVGG